MKRNIPIINWIAVLSALFCALKGRAAITANGPVTILVTNQIPSFTLEGVPWPGVMIITPVNLTIAVPTNVCTACPLCPPTNVCAPCVSLGCPQGPSNLTVITSSITSTSIPMVWNNPAQPWASDLLCVVLAEVPGTVSNLTIYGLDPSTTYPFVVVGATNFPPTSISTSNPAAPPIPPFGIQIATGSSSNIGGYVADEFYSGGSPTLHGPNQINTTGYANPPPNLVLNYQRYGNPFSYIFTSLAPTNTYWARMNFCENKWTAPNQRVFSVTINGALFITNLDLVATVGVNTMLRKTFPFATDIHGVATFTWNSTVDSARIDGLEITNGVPLVP